MNPEAANELRRIVEALQSGKASSEDQQLVAGMLQPAWVLLSQLPEDLVQVLMFTKPEDIELINVVLLTPKGGVQSMNDLPKDKVPS